MSEGNGNGRTARVEAVAEHPLVKVLARAAMIASAGVLAIGIFFAKDAWETLTKVSEASVVQTQTLIHHDARLNELKLDQATLQDKQQKLSDRIIILETKMEQRP